MADRFVSLAEVVDRVSFSKTHIYRKIAAGTFPRPVPLGPNKVAFLESEVDRWMAERLEAREAQEGFNERRQRASRRAAGEVLS
jgi:prophage regulatory protein